jgi:hypothetical protein
MIDSTMLASMFLLGLGVGVVFGWLAKSLRTQKRVTELSTTLEIERTKNDGFVRTFEGLSDKALRQNNQAFFELANERLGPLQKSLEQFDHKLQDVEKQRVGAVPAGTARRCRSARLALPARWVTAHSRHSQRCLGWVWRPQLALEAGKIQIPLLLPLALEPGEIQMPLLLPLALEALL